MAATEAVPPKTEPQKLPQENSNNDNNQRGPGGGGGQGGPGGGGGRGGRGRKGGSRFSGGRGGGGGPRNDGGPGRNDTQVIVEGANSLLSFHLFSRRNSIESFERGRHFIDARKDADNASICRFFFFITLSFGTAGSYCCFFLSAFFFFFHILCSTMFATINKLVSVDFNAVQL